MGFNWICLFENDVKGDQPELELTIRGLKKDLA
jgi:hypothetical protein